MENNNRYIDIIAESENMHQCKRCNNITIEVPVPNGVGRYANAQLYVFCENCEIYYMTKFNQDNLND